MADEQVPGLSPWQKFGMGATAGGMLGQGLFGGKGGRNPASAANPYLDQIPDTIKPYYQPYINAGMEAMPQLQKQFGQMMNDPGAMYNKLGQGYTQSPGYQWRLGQGQESINNAMASRGMSGTPEHGQQAGQLAENMAGADFDKYLGHLLGIQQGGLTGMSGLETQGYNASGDLATSLANYLQGKAGYAYAGQAGQNQQQAQKQSNMFGGLGAIGSMLGMMGGGAPGAAAGGAAGNMFSGIFGGGS